ncbi:hypothetical protein BDV96DRAFT_281139 [Lophiotrema nucula]|uniref:Uncharacterized protein n=1 Tax=Lophiotrema nucula TaxID=690887 RepID=A0A6A5ZQ14_9PLEO|nr:hypothetical protein BDV96DRAFT_281139 [Lophiotrema nucula]
MNIRFNMLGCDVFFACCCWVGSACCMLLLPLSAHSGRVTVQIEGLLIPKRHFSFPMRSTPHEAHECLLEVLLDIGLR